MQLTPHSGRSTHHAKPTALAQLFFDPEACVPVDTRYLKYKSAFDSSGLVSEGLTERLDPRRCKR
jgi:hypothetical protein